MVCTADITQKGGTQQVRLNTAAYSQYYAILGHTAVITENCDTLPDVFNTVAHSCYYSILRHTANLTQHYYTQSTLLNRNVTHTALLNTMANI